MTRNDTKINEVLFDTEPHKPLVVIDLDNVRPGMVGHDCGDAIRFTANFVEECLEAEKAGLNLNVCWAFAEGFLREIVLTLNEAEVSKVGNGCFAWTCELSTRFLGDHIIGDK